MERQVKMNAQKLTRYLAWAAIIAAQLSSATRALGQEVEEEVHVLSPFTVTAEDSDGYIATHTLSGTRIKSSLKDLGSAIQVVTEAFLDDTGVTSLEEVLTYTTSTESAGAFGNFANPSANGSRTFVGVDANRDSRNGQVSRIRGLAEADTSRNLFRSNIPLDSYNVSRVEVNRGANSILFGTGSPAGIINYQVHEAMWEDSNKIELRIDEESSNRVVVDFNRVLIEDKLAVRAIGLNYDRNFKQDPAYRDDHRYFVTATFKPFADTTLSGNYERGNIRSTLPRMSPPTDYFTNWFDFGKPTIALNGDERDGNTSNFLNTHVTSSSQTNQIILDATQGNIDSTQLGRGRIGSTSTFWTGIPNALADNPTDWRKKYASFNSTRAVLDAIRARPGNAGFGFVSTSGENPALQVLDSSVFDFYNNVLDGRQSWTDNDFESWNLSLRQEFMDGDLGFELSLNSEEFASTRNDALDSIRGYVLQIDSNEGGFQFNDPTDTASGEVRNPYFGRVYFGSRSVYDHNETSIESKRFTGFGRHDFTDSGSDSLINRILGRHTLTAMAEEVDTDSLSISGRTTGFDPGSWGATLGLTGGNLRTTGRSSAGVIFYISDDISDRSSASGINLTGYKGPRYLPNQVAVDYWDPEAGQIETGTFLLNDIEDGFDLTNTGASLGRGTIESQAAVLQSNWFDDILVTTLGWREDKVSTIGNGSNLRRENGSIILSSLTLGSETVQPATSTSSQSAVLRLGRLLGDLKPRSFDIDAHYAKSDNFRTSGGGLYAAKAGGQLFGGETGETEEMGFTLSFFEGKLTVRPNWFETQQGNLSDEDANSIYRAYRQIGNSVYDNNTLAEISAAGFKIPDHFKTDFGWVIVDNGDGTGFIETNPGANTNRGDVESGLSEGFEFETVYNITNNWRLIANVAKIKSVTTGAGQNMAQDVAFIQENWINNPGVAALFTDPAGPEAGTLGTVGGFAADRITGPYDTLLSLNGLSAGEVREWRGNLVTTYDFNDDSSLRGFSLGGGVRYQSGLNLGYRYEEKPDGSRGADLSQPIDGPSETNFDFWIGYRRKIFDDKVNWKLQLNIRNAFTGNELIPIMAQSNDNYSLIPEFSKHAATDYQLFRIAPPRLIELRSIFEF